MSNSSVDIYKITSRIKKITDNVLMLNVQYRGIINHQSGTSTLTILQATISTQYPGSRSHCTADW